MKRGFIFKYRQFLQFLLTTAIFSLAYTQEPIYNSPEYGDGNQNTKFFHGLAQAGYGLLNEDWLASTLDPLPAFTFLVRVTYHIHLECVFYLYYALLMGVYIFSLIEIANTVFKIKASRAKYLFYLALFISVHTVNLELGNFDTAWYLHAGVAQQYILGPVFQPSNFGALILLSIWLFLVQRYLWAVVALVIAATFHPAYIFSVAVLTLSYVLFLFPINIRKALLVGGVSFGLTLPVFSYTYFRFTATSPELQRQATDIIVNDRIPYHSVPDVWLADGTAQIQTLIVIISLSLIRNTRLFKILFIPFAIAFYLSFFQAIANNNFLAFLSPWRLSVFLVPISTSLILAALVTYIFQVQKQFINPRLLIPVSIVAISFLTIQGLEQQIALFNYQGKSTSMLNFVQQHKRSGDLYLVPPNSQQLQKFRLYTGAPIFINKKSHPYKDTEVLEWDNRLNLATNVYESEGDHCTLLKDLATQYNITHVVARQNFNCSFLEEIYQDSHYQVSRVF